jgi:glycosyltransferase involved in cell wall biosynthesis
MIMAAKTIGLCMIVKNESKVILRCLESVRPIVDYVLVEDTGSTDGTQTMIREWMSRVGMAGEVYDEPWRDFAYNRSHALAHLRKRAGIDYALIMDADDYVVYSSDFDVARFKSSLDRDQHEVEMRQGDIRYRRTQICSNKLEFLYRGVLHEFLSAGSRSSVTTGSAEGFYIASTREGARSQNPDKYRNDARILERALASEKDPFLRSRYLFYLARSYDNAGIKEKALENYLKRSRLGYWTEEIFMSLYSASHLQEALGYPVDDVINTLLRATKAAPGRAEALHAASRICRQNNRFAEGYGYAQRGLKISRPASGLFVVSWIYDYGLLDELAVNAYWSEHYQDCIDACERLLREGKLPDHMVDRVKKNAEFAGQKILERHKNEARLQTQSVPKQVLPPIPRGDSSKSMKKVGLCMIVKNESKVILRCLESVRPIVDYVLVEDTGSSDGTQSVIRAWLERAGLPGSVYDAPWRDFASNRSHALAMLRQQRNIDYVFVMDADDYVVYKPDFDVLSFKERLTADLYDVELHHGELRHRRPQLCSNKREFLYRGVLHEFIDTARGALSYGEGSVEIGHADGFYIETSHEGSRGQKPDRYRGDIDVLEAALSTESDPFLRSRYLFYLAQSYRELGEKSKALACYLERAKSSYWPEEVFVSLFFAGQIQEESGTPFDEVIATYLRACTAVPGRAEALHAASRLCRLKGKYVEGFEFAKRGVAISKPSDGLLVEAWRYDYGLLDELAVNAYWAERYEDCLEACERLLRENKLPQRMIARVRQNAKFSEEKIRLRNLLPTGTERPKSAESPSPPVQVGATKLSDHRAVPAKGCSTQFRIFRTIHVVWVGDEKKCPDQCIQTWREKNPDWNLRVWGNDELRSEEWENADHIRQMLTRELCGVADMMRWEILDRYGGFAIDADSICDRPLEDWLFEPEIFACWENEIARPGLIANGYVYSHPGNALIRQVISDIRSLPDVKQGLAWEITGPKRLTETYRRMAFADLTIYPSHYFMPSHLTGTSYTGSGPVFARQLWGRARANVYSDLAKPDLAKPDLAKSNLKL